ncbi:hypothetical protein Tsubulata_006145 [Turnera subulata]|uniref:Amino acid transporter transmembrane domain-containing protein n=1 Tax=Turnera subulata TaxID=218843 RepID=A0A9Q0F8P6_9ROSI|nr:hypothetical protein Tsubulata_006145 [Turnera subulata]
MGDIGLASYSSDQELPPHYNQTDNRKSPEFVQVITIARSSESMICTGEEAGSSRNKGMREDSSTNGQQNHDEMNLQDAWLPITESRNGNTATAVFHSLSSGIGIQALLLPVAFETLGWKWGIICLSIAFAWQLYTKWLLVQLHESLPGTRYSRYLQLAIAAFGPKLGKLLALFPVMYLSGGTCVMLIIRGAGTMELFFKQMICGSELACHEPTSLTGAEWFLLFTCIAILLAQRPNLNSVAIASFIGAITAVAYCTLIWVLPVMKSGRPKGVSYDGSLLKDSSMAGMCDALNAVGIIALSFRGHNLVLEIQARTLSLDSLLTIGAL